MNEIDDIKKRVNEVSKSLSNFMATGHLADNISHLTTSASILKILAKRLGEIRKNNHA
jgi:hypothetical protein